MPNKTLYVRDADIALFERAQEQLGESLSALFAEFLRERVTSLTNNEKLVVDLLRQIKREKENLRSEGVDSFTLFEFDHASAYAVEILNHLRRKDFVAAEGLWVGAQTFFNMAKQSGAKAKQAAPLIREICDELSKILGTESKTGTNRKTR